MVQGFPYHIVKPQLLPIGFPSKAKLMPLTSSAHVVPLLLDKDACFTARRIWLVIRANQFQLKSR